MGVLSFTYERSYRVDRIPSADGQTDIYSELESILAYEMGKQTKGNPYAHFQFRKVCEGKRGMMKLGLQNVIIITYR